MLVSLEEFRSRVESKDNLVNRNDETIEVCVDEVDYQVKDKYEYNKNVERLPENLRTLAAVEAHFSNNKSVAEGYGVHSTTVSKFKAGLTSHVHNVRVVDEERKTRIDELVSGKKKDIVSRVLDKLMAKIDDVEVNGTKADLNKSATLKNLGAIARQFSTDDKQSSDNRVQVLIMSPGLAKLDDYDVVEVGV